MVAACGHGFRTCHEAVQLLCDTAGSSSIYQRSPLERRLRDLTTLRQHVIAQLKLLEVVGALQSPLLASHII